MTALSMWWTVGWVVGAAVIVIVAALILTITGLVRKIDREAQQIVTDLDSVASKTRGLHDVGRTNIAVRAITRGLRIARGETGSVASPYETSPGWRE